MATDDEVTARQRSVAVDRTGRLVALPERNAYGEPDGPEDPERRYALIGPEELARPVPPMEWLIRGLWPSGSYGPWGGAKKTLKTYSASIAAVAVAAGVPAFNNPDWSVPQARPVIYYGGEGSRAMHQRRLQRIASEVYGLLLEDLPIYLVTDVGPLDSDDFRDALRRNVEEVEPGLVVLDSLYNYHPANIEASNLYERGRMLGALSALTLELDVAAWVVDHSNKSGSGIDLDRLAQAGMAQWADSWVLFEHANDPDVAAGRFTISTGVGSRQWGGTEHTLHVDIGTFDTAAGCYLTPMKVSVEDGITRRGSRAQEVDVARAILDYVAGRDDATYRRVRDAVKDSYVVGERRVKTEWDRLVVEERLVSELVKVQEGPRSVTREVWRTATVEPASGSRPVAPRRPGAAGAEVNRPPRGRLKVRAV